MLSEQCINRLINWKFSQAALKVRADATDDERELIEVLSRMFGNSGWFGGDMGRLVSAAVEKWTNV